ncbi:30S ribosomal protein S8 [Streptomyces sp. RKND-216]|nr:30S ribosomal protein S8 [Streptomyces sp. RKND-216]
MVRRVRVSQTRQHVCDRIGHGHVLAFGLSRRGFLSAPSFSPHAPRRRGGTGVERGPTA